MDNWDSVKWSKAQFTTGEVFALFEINDFISDNVGFCLANSLGQYRPDPQPFLWSLAYHYAQSMFGLCNYPSVFNTQ